MGFIENSLERLAVFQKRHGLSILIITAIITVFLGIGIRNIELESDFSKLMPQDLPIMELNSRITDKFSGQDTILVLLMLDDEEETKGLPVDIRHPLIMQYVLYLDQILEGESEIISVTSAAPAVRSAYAYGPVLSLDAMKASLESDPASAALISENYRMTMMIITADVGGSEKKVKDLTEKIDSRLSSLSTPPGVKVMVTGSPAIRVKIINMLKHDSVFTLFLASAIILLLLIITQRSFTEAFVIFTPIFLGIVWTVGTMGWLGIKISIVTAGLGAMILGLGVEYGVFMLTRYREERAKGKDQEESLRTSVPGVGSAVFGSGATTIVGFAALSFSIMPLLQTLGQSLALGIFFSLAAAILVEPVILVWEENFHYWHTKRTRDRMQEKHEGHKRMAR